MPSLINYMYFTCTNFVALYMLNVILINAYVVNHFTCTCTGTYVPYLGTCKTYSYFVLASYGRSRDLHARGYGFKFILRRSPDYVQL